MTTATARRRPGGGPVSEPRRRRATRGIALWAMMVGFFMILLDSTIVAVANPSIMVKLGTGYDTVIWVTSAYLLAYAVPLLVAGRLGDRFGPKNLYLVGLAIFTAASLWCGLSGTIAMLITARVAQGIGAAVMSPQTLSLITRIFPSERRGVAMSVWGATAGVATLVGPLAGGVLVDAMGWAWIFFVNVPIGLIGLGLAVWLVPELPTHKHRFDLIGVGLSGVGMFLIVFSLQEGQSHDWAPWIWAVLVAGIGLMTAFVYWQSISTHEPLIPLDIFRDRDFSLCNVAAVVIAFAATGMILPLMFYAQAVCGLSPTRSALLTAPMAITSGALAPIAGRLVDRVAPAAGGRIRVLVSGDRTHLAFDRDDPVHRDLGTGAAVLRAGCGDGVHLGADDRDRDPQPAAAVGRRQFRCVQRDSPSGCRARQCRHGVVHDVANRRSVGADARRGIGPAGRARCRPGDAGVPARAFRRRDVAVDVVAGVRRAVRDRRGAVPGRIRRSIGCSSMHAGRRHGQPGRADPARSGAAKRRRRFRERLRRLPGWFRR